MKACQILFFIGVFSIALSAEQAENENWLDELADRMQEKLLTLKKKIDRSREGLHENIVDFIDNLKDISTKVKDELTDLADIAEDQVEALMSLFQDTVNIFEEGKRSSRKNRRGIQNLADSVKEGLNSLGSTMQEFFDVLKPATGSISSVALDVHRSLDKAADKFLDSL